MPSLVQLVYGMAVSLAVSLHFDKDTVARLWLKTLPIWNEVNLTKQIQKDYRLYKDNTTTLLLYCDTCAYVVNSGHLLNRNKGKEIDSRNCVIRSNTAPVTGYEKDVGSRTTVRIVNGLTFGAGWKQLTIERMYRTPYFDVNLINQTIFLQYENFSDADRDVALGIWPRMRLYEVSEAKRKAVKEAFLPISNGSEEIKITNGFWSMNIIFDFCGEVHVYGLPDSHVCDDVFFGLRKDTPYHYYPPHMFGECKHYKDNLNKSSINNHRFIEEKKLFKKWLDVKKNLFFHVPEW